MLPNDIDMLVSYLNTKLRDDDMSLDMLLEIESCNKEDIFIKLDNFGFSYDELNRQIKKR